MLIGESLLKKYSQEKQNEIRERIVKIVKETFIDTADSDYINARFLSLNHQYRSFFWSALQALEKYLKANLLFLDKPVKKFGHKIVLMSNELSKYSPVLRDISLSPHELHKELEDLLLWGDHDVIAYLTSIEKFGSPSNRYNYCGSDYEASFLLKLDKVVYALRKNIVGDALLFGVKNNEALKYYAYEQNVLFAPPNYDHGTIYGKLGLGMSVTTLERALNGAYGHADIFEKWVTENMQFGKNEIEDIKTG